eukprot:IDg21354t1
MADCSPRPTFSFRHQFPGSLFLPLDALRSNGIQCFCHQLLDSKSFVLSYKQYSFELLWSHRLMRASHHILLVGGYEMSASGDVVDKSQNWSSVKRSAND